MPILLTHAHVVGPNEFDGDIRIDNGVISALGTDLLPDADTTVIDAHHQTVMPGLVDVHVHFREPGYTDKETIKTGAAAAAHGGFTTVVAMPNLEPVPDNVDALTALIAKNQSDAKIHVRQFAAITKGLHSADLNNYRALKAAGALGFSNDGVGVQDAATMLAAMKAAKAVDAPIAAHIEDEGLMNHGVINAGPAAERLHLPGIPGVAESAQLARDLELANLTGVHYHACHVSTKESVALIRAAKQRGINVTAEATPHHLLLDETDITSDNPMFKMNPPLREPADREALIAGLLDGTIDMIATDHAPHTVADKQGTFATASFGIVGSETAFALLYTRLVTTGVCSLNQLIDWMSTAPAKAFGLPAGTIAVGQPADLTIADLTQTTAINPDDWLAKGHNSPFIGQQVQASILMTIAGGRIAYQTEGKF